MSKKKKKKQKNIVNPMMSNADIMRVISFFDEENIEVDDAARFVVSKIKDNLRISKAERNTLNACLSKGTIVVLNRAYPTL